MDESLRDFFQKDRKERLARYIAGDAADYILTMINVIWHEVGEKITPPPALLNSDYLFLCTDVLAKIPQHREKKVRKLLREVEQGARCIAMDLCDTTASRRGLRNLLVAYAKPGDITDVEWQSPGVWEPSQQFLRAREEQKRQKASRPGGKSDRPGSEQCSKSPDDRSKESDDRRGIDRNPSFE